MPLGQAPQPADVQPNPYLPPGPEPNICERWQGVRTDTNRVGVPDESVYWLDGIMPYEERRARSMYGIGTAIFTAAGGLSIVFYRFVTLLGQPLCIVLMSDGSILQINLIDNSQKTVAPAGTIASPGQQSCDISQWGNQYVLIVAVQTNGYWAWDGNVLYTAGTLGPVITITNVGSGYTTPPIVTASGGHGSGAIFTAYLNDSGGISSIVMNSPGSGYLATDTPSLVLTGGISSGTGASLVVSSLAHNAGGSGAAASITAFGNLTFNGITYATVKSVVVTSTGSGYSPVTRVRTVAGAGSPANLKAVISGGQITAVTVVDGGAYTTRPSTSINFTDTGGYSIAAVSVVAPGSGYSNFPSISYTLAASGSLAQAPVFNPIIANGTFSSVAVVNGGLQGGSVAGTLSVSDVGVGATATLTIMPFAISGNTVETYQGYVWVGNGAIIFNSAPGSVSDFNISDGGGNLTSNDSFLKVGYTKFAQMNGLLYLVSDCAVSYISGVQTVPVGTLGAVATTFTKQNADPEVGTVWPNAVLSWGNALMLSNSWGEFVGSGSRLDKVSIPMDGVYPDPTASLSIIPSMAKAIAFKRKIVCLLIPITDPVSNTLQNKLLIWDGKKWWASKQDVTLTYIATQELNSVLTAFGTDGTHIYPLFSQPSTAFAKVIQTKLWDRPGSYLFRKASSRLWGVAKYNTVMSPNLVIGVDNETGANTSSYTITGASGYFVFPPQAVGQQGIFEGLTITTNEGDIEFVSVALGEDITQYRG